MQKSPDFVVDTIKTLWCPGMKILEIGCGPAFLRKTFGQDYIGCDITDAPYGTDLPRDVDIVCTADKLLVEDASIDIVVIKSAFFLFPDHTRSLNEAYRVLKTNGKLLIFDYNQKTQRNLQTREGHNNYPCWTQWQLKRLVKGEKFVKTRLLLPESKQPIGITKLFLLVLEEFFGNWAIVCGMKE